MNKINIPKKLDNGIISLQNEIINRAIEEFDTEFKQIIIKGLKIKGYTFNSEIELLVFVSINCKVIDNNNTKQKTFYVNDTPFMIYDYKIEVNNFFNDKEIKITANYGKYLFV